MNRRQFHASAEQVRRPTAEEGEAGDATPADRRVRRRRGRQAGIPSIRAARVKDLEAINAMYNYYVLRSTCTYQEKPETRVARRAWFERHGAQHPVIVAECDGQVAGWGSLSPYHARSAFRHTVENSVYVAQGFHGRGIGSALLRELIACARALGYRAIIAGIDAGQAASVALHAKFGFKEVGRFRQVGRKFSRWLDVIYMELLLSEEMARPRARVRLSTGERHVH